MTAPALSASDFYARGELDAAIDALTQEVKKNVRDFDKRGFLAELLCVKGELDRADAQLEAMAKLDSAASPGLALFRQLIRAERTRQEVHRSGRAPEFLAAPSAALRSSLQALTLLRAGDMAGAATCVEEAEAARPRCAGTCDGASFADVRDLDDICAGALEVLTSTGKLMWVPFENIASIVFDKPARPRDLLWRPAEVSVRGGPDGKVYVPTTYAPARGEPDNAARLGRRTDWIGGENEPVTGLGLRTFVFDETPRTVLEVREITFAG
jgi:type VI secretion system protein ImpE